MNKGDVYKWEYKGSLGNQADLYWCKARLAIFDGETLFDLYWHNQSSRNIVNVDEVNLTFIANMDDLRNCNEGEMVYYEDKDCVSLNHPNSTRGNFYVFKKAKRSLRKMRLIQQRIVDNEREKMERASRNLSYALKELNSLTIESSVMANTEIDFYDYGEFKGDKEIDVKGG